MTNEQKEKIIELRKLGIGYRSIATAMDLSRDSVRNFCKSRGLDGFGQDYSKPKPDKVIRQHCKNCGKQINQKRLKGRPKTYCSTECKREWEHKNPIIYKHVCYYCGTEFENKSKSGNYCCRRCYIRDRFWRDEDIEDVIKHLKERRPLQNVPIWIQDLMDGKEAQEPDDDSKEYY